MADSDTKSLVSVTLAGDLSKPATVLIEKISEALGGAFRPFQIRRIAQAEADAAITHAKAEIEITGLQRRAVERFVAEEAQKQANIESITDKALPLLDAQAKPEKVEKDWITNFFDECRLISDEQMQALWATILAGEANAPGKFSKRTIDLLGSFDKSDALDFSNLCRFVVHTNDWLSPCVFNYNEKLYIDQGIHFGSLSHLDSIGFIRFDAQGNFSFVEGGVGNIYVRYFGHRFTPSPAIRQMNVGHVIFTKPGRELTSICVPTEVPDFFDYWKQCLNIPGDFTEDGED